MRDVELEDRECLAAGLRRRGLPAAGQQELGDHQARERDLGSVAEAGCPIERARYAVAASRSPRSIAAPPANRAILDISKVWCGIASTSPKYDRKRSSTKAAFSASLSSTTVSNNTSESRPSPSRTSLWEDFSHKARRGLGILTTRAHLAPMQALELTVCWESPYTICRTTRCFPRWWWCADTRNSGHSQAGAFPGSIQSAFFNELLSRRLVGGRRLAKRYLRHYDHRGAWHVAAHGLTTC